MKKVLLLGDSIRMGYQNYVKEILENKCEVFYDEFDNGRFTSYTYWQMNQMLKKVPDIDIIHFNNGYWDMNIEKPMNENLFSLDEYLYFLKKIVTFGQSLKIKMIFSTILPINDDKKDTSDIEIGYTNEMIKQYNEAAIKLMNSLNVEVIDLYQEMLDKDDYYKCPDQVHLTNDGYLKCAKKITSVINKYL